MVGNPFEESLSGQQRQSLAFANLIAGMRQRTSGAITVAIENAGSGRPSTPYPARAESVTAGEWNRAAAANNRVEFAAESRSGGRRRSAAFVAAVRPLRAVTVKRRL